LHCAVVDRFELLVATRSTGNAGLFNLGAARLCAWLSELNLGSAQARAPDSCCPAGAEQTFSAHNRVRGLSDRWLKTGRYQVVESIDHCAMQTNHCAADACLRVL